jgi:hypothetical protein
MKKILTAAVLLSFPLFIFAQDLSGLWKGTMYNDVTKKTLPYELFIKKEKGKYTGYTYSWFIIGGDEYFGVKKVKVSKAKDGKIVILDDALMENNYPIEPAKKVKQLNVLDLSGAENEMSMDGLFVTNITKQFMEVTGHVSVKKTSPFSESSLMQYLQKNTTGIEIAALK